MKSKFPFKIISADGKVFIDNIDELYVTTKNGVIGILSGHFPLVAIVEISIIKIIKDNVVSYFSISGGVLNVEKDNAYILADTFEKPSEIDKERVLKSKHEAEEKLAKLSKEDVIAFKNAEFQLKKALNRIRLVK